MCLPFSNFIKGLRRPSAFVLAFTLILFGLGLWGFDSWIREGKYIVIPEERLLLRKTDQFHHISYQVARLKREETFPPRLVMLGGSSMRECVESDSSFSRSLTEELGVRVSITNLGYFRQSFGESIAILDQLKGTENVVLLGINLRRFTFPQRHYLEQIQGKRLVLISQSLNQFVVQEGISSSEQWTVLPAAFRHLYQYVNYHRKELSEFRLPWNEFQHHIYIGKKTLSYQEKEAMIKKVLDFYPKYFEPNLEMNLRALRGFLDLAARKKIPVVFLELPLNPRLRTAFAKFSRVYQQQVRSVARARGIPYWNFLDQINLQDHHFNDHAHLLKSGRKIYQAELTSRLAHYYGKKSPFRLP